MYTRWIRPILFGGVCAAVNPEKTTAEKSQIAQVIADNKKKLAEKMGSKPAEMPDKLRKMREKFLLNSKFFYN